jgi:septum formation protein
LAKGKALSISKKFPSAYVIGSDQVCEFEKEEFSKAANLSQAASQLKKFNGKTHFQNNATVVALNGKIVFQNFSRVKMEMR